MRIFCLVLVFLSLAVFLPAQDQIYRGSIPEELLRPKRGEAARFPIDTVIGELGQGTASPAAYSYAKTIAAGLLSANADNSGLAGINAELRKDYITVLEEIYPKSYRLGGGREEADGAVSFMIRFIGKDSAITGELFVRYVTRQIKSENEEEEEVKTVGSWKFEDLILEEAKSREEEDHESLQRFDFSPYERFF
jgi:hypothetical protein